MINFKITKYRFIFLGALILFMGCEEIVSVPDISEETVTIVSPNNGFISTNTRVALRWKSLEFADTYNIQVAQPSFAQPTAVVVDTIISDSTQNLRRLTTNLNPSPYQWRIKGINSDFETGYSIASFTVDTLQGVDDISNTQVILNAPINDAVVTTETLLFNWNSVFGATSYTLQIATPTFENPIQLLTNEDIEATSFQTTLPNNAYQWRVKAKNQISETDYTTEAFMVDTQAAADISSEEVMLLAPTDMALFQTPNIQFTWEAVAAAESYQLQVATPNFTNPLQFVVNTTLTETASESFTIPEGSYQWRVKALNTSSETGYSTRAFEVALGNDLSQQVTQLIAPSQGAVVANETVNFTWEPLAAATSYQLQIAQPDFANPVQIIADDLVDDALTQTYMLEEGAYEWRVKAINATSETPFSSAHFDVDTNAELSDQTVLILSPIDGYVSSSTSVNLQWEALSQATVYRVIITDETGAVFLEETTANTILGVDFISGNYLWKVRAENASQNTPYSEQSIIIQ